MKNGKRDIWDCDNGRADFIYLWRERSQRESQKVNSIWDDAVWFPFFPLFFFLLEGGWVGGCLGDNLYNFE